MNLAYTIRPSKDEENTLLDLNRQLWSCVRTNHVEISLRLLALGADPNYSDPEKGNCPLHIAAKEGQMLQSELLWIYGADVAQKNSSGHSPADIAKMEGHVGYSITSNLNLFSLTYLRDLKNSSSRSQIDFPRFCVDESLNIRKEYTF